MLEEPYIQLLPASGPLDHKISARGFRERSVVLSVLDKQDRFLSAPFSRMIKRWTACNRVAASRDTGQVRYIWWWAFTDFAIDSHMTLPNLFCEANKPWTIPSPVPWAAFSLGCKKRSNMRSAGFL